MFYIAQIHSVLIINHDFYLHCNGIQILAIISVNSATLEVEMTDGKAYSVTRTANTDVTLERMLLRDTRNKKLSG